MRRALKNALIVSAALLYPLAVIALFFHGNWYSFFHSYSLAMAFGLLAYCYFTLALILGSRVKALDRIFGHDRILIFHGVIAAIALACAIAHALLKKLYFPDDTVQSTLDVLGLALFLFVIFMTVLLMLETPLDRTPFVSHLTRFIKKRVRADYTLLKLLHNLTAPAFALIVLHVLLASPVQETTSKTAFAGLTGALALAFYAYHKLARPIFSMMNAYAIASVKRLSGGIIEIETVSRRGRALRHTAGQFAFFRFIDRSCGLGEHPFTVSSPPSARGPVITVKALGDFTAKLGSLRKGATCFIDGPYGLFYPRRNDRDLLFLAGGIGITPFLSILRDYTETKRSGDITLLWSVRHKDEAFARDELGTIASILPGLVVRILVTGEPSFGKDVPDSRIDGAIIRESLARLGSAQGAEAYICGPDAFRRSVQGLLLETGFPGKDIYYEAFSF